MAFSYQIDQEGNGYYINTDDGSRVGTEEYNAMMRDQQAARDYEAWRQYQQAAEAVKALQEAQARNDAAAQEQARAIAQAQVDAAQAALAQSQAVAARVAEEAAQAARDAKARNDAAAQAQANAVAAAAAKTAQIAADTAAAQKAAEAEAVQKAQQTGQAAQVKDIYGATAGATTQEQVAQAAQNAAAPTTYANETTKLFQTILGRAPTPAEIKNIDTALANGTMSSFDQVKQAVLSSPEYTSKALPFLQPGADVKGRFESGAYYYNQQGLTPSGDYEGVPTAYYDKAGNLVAWFGNLGTKDNKTNDTSSYTWHTPQELSLTPDAVPVTAHPRPEDAQLVSALKGIGFVAATIGGAYLLGPVAGAAATTEAAGAVAGEIATAGIGPAGAATAANSNVAWLATLGQNALKQGAINAVMAGISGKGPADMLKAAGMGALSAGIGGAISQGVNTAVGNIASSLGMETLGTTAKYILDAGMKAGTAAVTSAVTGRDPLQGAMASVIGSVVAPALNSSFEGFSKLPNQVQDAIIQSVSSGVAAAAKGGDVQMSVVNGLIGSAVKSVADYVGNGFRDIKYENLDQLVKELTTKAETGATATLQEWDNKSTQEKVKILDPNFEAANYKTINKLGADVDPYEHYLTTGRKEGLYTNAASYLEFQRDLDTAVAFDVKPPSIYKLISTATKETPIEDLKINALIAGRSVPTVDADGKVVSNPPSTEEIAAIKNAPSGVLDYLLDAPRNIRDQFMAAGEVGMNVLGGIVGNIAAAGYGVGTTWANLATGEPVDVKAINEQANKIAELLSYQPTLESSKHLLEVISKVPELMLGSTMGLDPTIGLIGDTASVRLPASDLAVLNAAVKVYGKDVVDFMPDFLNAQNKIYVAERTTLGERASNLLNVGSDIYDVLTGKKVDIEDVPAKDLPTIQRIGNDGAVTSLGAYEAQANLDPFIPNPDPNGATRYIRNPALTEATALPAAEKTFLSDINNRIQDQWALDTTGHTLPEGYIKPVNDVQAPPGYTFIQSPTGELIPVEVDYKSPYLAQNVAAKAAGDTTIPTATATEPTPINLSPWFDLTGSIAESEAAIAKQMAANQAAGQNSDLALQNAINKVASDAQLTKTEFLTKLGTSEAGLLQKLNQSNTDLANQIQTSQVASQQYTKDQVAASQKAILDRAAAYESAGMARDDSLAAAIAENAQALNLTKTDFLSKLNTTADNLSAQMTAGQAQTAQQTAQQIAASQAQTAQQLADTRLTLQNQIATNEKAGQDRSTATDNAVKDLALTLKTSEAGLLSALNLNKADLAGQISGVQGQVTGLGTQVQDLGKDLQGQITNVNTDLTNQITGLNTDLTGKISTASKQANVGSLMNMLMGASDIGGQQVSVKAPDPAKINYLYDFNSIFANPQQQKMFTTPYGPTGMAEGGSVDDLIKILKGQ